MFNKNTIIRTSRATSYLYDWTAAFLARFGDHQPDNG